ncbi:hypothetical protein [Nisaea sp.]|uniref:hypothetical protein n=1 Tax=Nisaea sp. TaxID=2024842 RepID=UPI0032977C7B
MTSSAALSATTSFTKEMFSDPSMRPHLENYYETQYSAFRARIEDMKEAEANGTAPNTLTSPDGITGTELSAAQYESMIPSFDRWLEMQQQSSVFDQVEFSSGRLEDIKTVEASIEKSLNPDLTSGVRTVFSDGDTILGYINNSGQLTVTHPDGKALAKIADEAKTMNMTSEERIAYIRDRGAAELPRNQINLEITDYTETNMPTRRAFAAEWYPDQDVDARYREALQEIKSSVEQWVAAQDKQMNNLNEMHAFLLQSQQVEQAV